METLAARLRAGRSLNCAARGLPAESFTEGNRDEARSVGETNLGAAMKMISLLGGIGSQATQDFEARVHVVSPRLLSVEGNRGYPPLVVVDQRQPLVLLVLGQLVSRKLAKSQISAAYRCT